MTIAPDLILDEATELLHADQMPVIKKSATPAASAATASAPSAVRPTKDWISGWCTGSTTAGGCRDGNDRNKAGEPIVRCLYLGQNGSNVPNPIVYCACPCHDKARLTADPNLGIKRKPIAPAKAVVKAAATPAGEAQDGQADSQTVDVSAT